MLDLCVVFRAIRQNVVAFNHFAYNLMHIAHPHLTMAHRHAVNIFQIVPAHYKSPHCKERKGKETDSIQSNLPTSVCNEKDEQGLIQSSLFTIL